MDHYFVWSALFLILFYIIGLRQIFLFEKEVSQRLCYQETMGKIPNFVKCTESVLHPGELFAFRDPITGKYERGFAIVEKVNHGTIIFLYLLGDYTDHGWKPLYRHRGSRTLLRNPVITGEGEFKFDYYGKTRIAEPWDLEKEIPRSALIPRKYLRSPTEPPENKVF